MKENIPRGASPSRSGRKQPPPPPAEGPPRQGASAGLEQSGLEAYFSHHRLIARDSLMRLIRNPLSSLMTWLVIAVALALPSGLFVMLGNLGGLTEGLEGASRVSLYMKLNVDDQTAYQLAQKLKERPEVQSMQFINRSQALEEFKSMSGWGDVLAYLDDNPLPAVIVLQPSPEYGQAEKVQAFTESLSKLPEVDNVQLDLQWVKRLNALFEVLGRSTLAIGALLGLAVILIIGNTIRLAIENRKDEILVVKLVGGTDPFVRRPFLYTGFWYGVGGALLAWLLVNMALLWLSGPVNQLAALYYSSFNLSGLSIEATSLLLLTGSFLGCGGAWLAVRRHLDDIEPK
ncbi:permease-like cell division protein FtsX [Hahella aquimaris]|uniref:permease-like cell division protein FtsX n=1 Tax=Hahella sp. HNIBRBA332 TaxID=3015983 RepID=UPI00273C84AF|nr:permease-like cell division protein FtsX [Hahella sp. HNIBRBA332]WLQ12594.1 permease-like cell division protein FtsX [Hahella sp. HNIBRBA332]